MANTCLNCKYRKINPETGKTLGTKDGKVFCELQSGEKVEAVEDCIFWTANDADDLTAKDIISLTKGNLLKFVEDILLKRKLNVIERGAINKYIPKFYPGCAKYINDGKN